MLVLTWMSSNADGNQQKLIRERLISERLINVKVILFLIHELFRSLDSNMS